MLSRMHGVATMAMHTSQRGIPRAMTPRQTQYKRQQLEEEPHIGRYPGEEGKRRRPSTKKEGDGHTAGGHHAQVFAQEKEREFEAGILDIVAGDDLGFAFGKIEGRAVGLGGSRNHEEDEADESPWREYEPVRPDAAVAGLPFHNGHEIGRAHV